MAAVEHLVAGAGIGPQQQRDQLVRAGAADDASGIERMSPPERCTELLGIALWVAVDLARQRAVGGQRLGAGPERALVRGETDRALDAGDLRLAADIGRDVEDAGAGRQRGFGDHFCSALCRGRDRSDFGGAR